MPELNKCKFLVMYDYGAGSVLCYISARDECEITDRYPEFEILKSVPSWLSEERRIVIEEKLSFDIDERPQGFLQGVLEDRERERRRRNDNE